MKISAGTPLPEYKSVVANWDLKSSVRSKPRRLIQEDEPGTHFFSAKLTPAASHELVIDRGVEGRLELLTRRLYSYLDFTTILEQEIVNPVVLRLSRDAYGLTLPANMQFDAYRIYCDEAYHAFFSVDMKNQVARHTGIVTSGWTAEPYFAKVIRRVRDSLPADLSDLVELCAAVVSETLISGSLTDIPADRTVAPAVREMMADHAADERTHHAYFTKVLEIVWPQFDVRARTLLGPYFADFITAFLMPDKLAQQEMLQPMGFKGDEIDRILWESHPIGTVLEDIRRAARSTLRLLHRTGVLEEPRTRERFAELGLL